MERVSGFAVLICQGRQWQDFLAANQ